MTRLDTLAQPRRRNGEHIRAIIERERRQAHELESLARLSLSSSRSSPTADGGASSKRMSRSMSQLASSTSSSKYRHPSQESHAGSRTGGRKSSFNSSLGDSSPMGRLDTSKSMSQLNTAGRVSRLTKTERLRQQVREQLNGSTTTTTTTTTVHTSYSTTATGARFERPFPKIFGNWKAVGYFVGVSLRVNNLWFSNPPPSK